MKLDPSVRALVQGVVAAPKSFDPDGWMALAAENPSPEMVMALHALKAEVEKSFDDGLEVSPAPASRIEGLRAELARREVTGFIVPRADEHQNEYTPRCAQRLRWITGFSGSAGAAVIRLDKAAVFVDGRYTLQAAAEVDPKLFETRHLVEQPPAEWVTQNFKKGDRLAYDPWLHGSDEVAALAKACETAGATLVAVDDDPIDAVWGERAPAPLSRVRVHAEHLSGKTSAAKIADIGKALRDKGCGATVLSNCDSVAWLLNIRGEDLPSTPFTLAYATVFADERVDLFIDERKLTSEARGHLPKSVTVRPYRDVAKAMDELGKSGGTVMIDQALTPAAIADRLQKSGAKLNRDGDPVLLPKAQKNPIEIQGARDAHIRDAAAMARFLFWLSQRAPTGELDELTASAALLASRRRDKRFRDESFEAISGAGPNGAIVHYRSTAKTNRNLENPSVYLIDSGGQYEDGTTDVTRTVAIGTPTAEQRDRFTRVLKGHIAIATARFPVGTTGSQLDALARMPLWEVGLDYDHGTGHGVGSYLSVHEGPQRISKVPNRIALKPGMIVSNEPGYYKANAYGIRIETLVVVTPQPKKAGEERDMLGFETLTLVPIDTTLVEPALLTDKERVYLNEYHARVRNVVTPLVEADVAAWLSKVTAAV
ncbi:MAG: aminopeptidase P family protein [Myxococcota bacterium]